MNIWPFKSRNENEEDGGQGPNLQLGFGTRATANALGFSLSVPQGGAVFDHPWRPALGGLKLKLRPGRIYSTGGDTLIEPVIKSGGRTVPMSGDARNAAPFLELDPGVANSAGESWAALEVVPNEAGEITKDARVEIIHTATPISHAKTLGRCPLVMILWKNKRPLRAEPITRFNLRYLRVVDTIGARHFFL